MTWPTSRPGYPMHAERDGWHWLMIGHGVGHPFPMLWCADGEMWEAGDDGYVDAADISTRWNYLGPCYTQADLDAAVQAERDGCAKWHDERKAYCDQRAQEKIKDGDSLAADTPIIVGLAHEHSAAAIRARGPTSALDAALAQAREKAIKDAAAYLLEQMNPTRDREAAVDLLRIFAERSAAAVAAMGMVGR